MRVLVMDKRQRGIFLDQLGDRRREFNLVLAVWNRYGHAIDRRLDLELERLLCRAFGAGDRLTRSELLEPAQCHGVPGLRSGYFLGLRAHQLKDTGNAPFLPAASIE